MFNFSCLLGCRRATHTLVNYKSLSFACDKIAFYKMSKVEMMVVPCKREQYKLFVFVLMTDQG